MLDWLWLWKVIHISFIIIICPSSPVFDEMPIKGLRYLSQSTDSLNRTNQVTESMESLTDEGQHTNMHTHAHTHIPYASDLTTSDNCRLVMIWTFVS